jgi:hypothetical protein
MCVLMKIVSMLENILLIHNNIDFFVSFIININIKYTKKNGKYNDYTISIKIVISIKIDITIKGYI